MKTFVVAILLVIASAPAAAQSDSESDTEFFELGLTYGRTEQDQIFDVGSVRWGFELQPDRLELGFGISALKFYLPDDGGDRVLWTGEIVAAMVAAMPALAVVTAFGDSSRVGRIIAAPLMLPVLPCVHPSLEWRAAGPIWLTTGWDGEWRIFQGDPVLAWRPRAGLKINLGNRYFVGGGAWRSFTRDFDDSGTETSWGWYVGLRSDAMLE